MESIRGVTRAKCDEKINGRMWDWGNKGDHKLKDILIGAMDRSWGSFADGEQSVDSIERFTGQVCDEANSDALRQVYYYSGPVAKLVIEKAIENVKGGLDNDKLWQCVQIFCRSPEQIVTNLNLMQIRQDLKEIRRLMGQRPQGL